MPEAGTTQTSVASSYLAGLVFVCLGISEKLAILPAHHQSRHHVIESQAWRSAETCTFATFIYEKGSERLLRHITGTDENEVIRQALVWCEREAIC
jgi:hypothetical protein